MYRFIDEIYFKCPPLLQDMIISVYGYKLYRERYMGNHDKYLKQLLATQWYSKAEIDQLVEDRFISMFKYAIENVPYYRELVRLGTIKPDEVKGVSDLDRLPIISKERIRANPEYFLADGFRKKDLITINTSGTTGKTLTIFVDKDSRRYAYAFFSRFKIWADINPELKNVTFAGRTIVSPDAKNPPFWRKNLPMNNYLFSSYHLSPQYMKYYIEKLREIQPHFIDSYPSSIYAIAHYMKDNGLSGIFPKAIITSSETLFDYQRVTIEEMFNCPVFDQYGCAEQVVFISQCEKGTYHNHPEYGIVELIRDDGSKAMPGEPARLICTGFTNSAMPLIRYDIGDIGVLSDRICNCGRNFPVVDHIVGRTDDIITTRDGRQVGRLDPVFKGLQSIREAQIIQKDYEKIHLYIVPGKNYQEREAENIVWELKKRLGNETEVTVEIVQEISKASSGKFRAVISKIGKA